MTHGMIIAWNDGNSKSSIEVGGCKTREEARARAIASAYVCGYTPPKWYQFWRPKYDIRESFSWLLHRIKELEMVNDLELLKRNGWEVISTDPPELYKAENNSRATNEAAMLVKAFLDKIE